MMNSSPLGHFGFTSILGVALVRYFEKRTKERRWALVEALVSGAMGDQGDGLVLWHEDRGGFGIYVGAVKLAHWDGEDRIILM